MVLYVCANCNKTFTKKCDWVRHERRKYKCAERGGTHQIPPKAEIPPPKSTKIGVNSAFLVDTSKNVCEFCNKMFSRTDSLLRHQNGRCAKQNNELNQIKQDLKQKTTEMVELTECVRQLTNMLKTKVPSDISGNIVNNINIVTTNINNNININICEFGSNDVSYRLMTEAEQLEILKSGDSALIRFVENLHFNERIPQYMNVYRSNMRDNKCHIFQNGKWCQKDLDYVTCILLVNGANDIEQIIMDMHKQQKVDFSILNVRNLINGIFEQNDKTTKQQKDMVGTILYNERDKVEHNKKLLKKK